MYSGFMVCDKAYLVKPVDSLQQGYELLLVIFGKVKQGQIFPVTEKKWRRVGLT